MPKSSISLVNQAIKMQARCLFSILFFHLLCLHAIAKTTLNVNGGVKVKGTVLGPVIMPMLFYGPSNQIHQAKEAIYTMLGDKSVDSVSTSGYRAFTLMLPYILPHYSQAKVEGFTAFSEYFEILSSSVIEEQDVFRAVLADSATGPLSVKDGVPLQKSTPARLGTRKAALVRHLLANLPKKCTVYHRWGLTGRLLERCGEQVDWFVERSGGRACREYEFIPFLGNLQDVAAVMRAADTDFALSCFLERAMSTKLVIDRVKSISESAAGNIDSETEAHKEKVRLWFDVANVLRLKVGENSLPIPTFTLHLRAPDPVVLRKKRKASEDFIIGKDPKKNAVLHRSVLSNLIEIKILEVEEDRNVSIGTIHLMTNDLVLADYVHNHFQALGYTVTFSPDRSLKALMNDYVIAAQSVAFYGMQKSSITTNIEHARIALLGINKLSGDRFWEDIIPDANY